MVTFVAHGSAQLVRSLIENDLVDEVPLMVFPVLLGRDKRPFDETTTRSCCSCRRPPRSVPASPSRATRESDRSKAQIAAERDVVGGNHSILEVRRSYASSTDPC
jgi:RibD C-terminal domain